MEKYVSGDEAGVEMGQAAFQRFIENPGPAEVNSEEFAEEIAEYEIGYSQNCDGSIEHQDGYKAGKKEECYRREFPVFFWFVEILDVFEKEDVDLFRDESDQVKSKEEKDYASDQDQRLFFIRLEVVEDKKNGQRPEIETPVESFPALFWGAEQFSLLYIQDIDKDDIDND